MVPEKSKFIELGPGKKNPKKVLVDKIEPHPIYPKERLKDLKGIEESIRGIGFDNRQALKVIPHPTKRGYYQLMDGHRRLEATKKCLTGPDCPENLKNKVPVVVSKYNKEKLDILCERDYWQRYPIPCQKARFKNALYCPQSGTKLMPGDNFCPECGFRLR